MQKHYQCPNDLVGYLGYGYVCADDTAPIVMFNRAFCRMLGIDGLPVLDRPLDGSMCVDELFISPVMDMDSDGTVIHFVSVQHLQMNCKMEESH